MKNMLIMGGLGAVLFLGTVLGLMAVQGRLNHEGAKNIPLLNMFFPEPPADEQGEDGKGKDEHAGAEHDAETGHGDSAGHGEQNPEPNITKTTSKDLAEAGDNSGGQGGGHGGGEAAARGEGEHGVDPKTYNTAPKVPDQPSDEAQHARQVAEAARPHKGYQPGKLFNFDGLESNISVDEINRMHQQVRQREAQLKFDAQRLTQERKDLLIQKADIAERIKQLGALRQSIRDEQQALDQKMQDEARLHTLITEGEAKAQEATVKVLAEANPTYVLEYIRDLWQASGGSLETAGNAEPSAQELLQRNRPDTRIPEGLSPREKREAEERAVVQRRFRKDLLAILRLLGNEKLNEVFPLMEPTLRRSLMIEMLGTRMIGAQASPIK